jgi:hypothetical protein
VPKTTSAVPTQSLEDFVKELRADANRFERYWVKMNKTQPDRYPMRIGGGDWWEQFLAWLETS